MLDALPNQEAASYSAQEKVVREGSRFQELFKIITEHNTFAGGSQAKPLAYLRWPIPPGMWGWAWSSEVQATCGFSVVGEKTKNGVPHPEGAADVLPR